MQTLHEEIISMIGNLGISRDKMPQIDASEIDNFKTYLADNNIKYEIVNIVANELTPTQSELDTDKADKIYNDGNAWENEIIISEDNFVLDGHHRWLAVVRNSEDQDMKALKIGLSAEDCLECMHNFKGTKKRDISDKVVEKFTLLERIQTLLREDMDPITSLSDTLLSELREEVSEYASDWPDEIFQFEAPAIKVDNKGNPKSSIEITSAFILDPYDTVSTQLESYDKTIEKKYVKDSDYDNIFSGLTGKVYEVKMNIDTIDEDGAEFSTDVFFDFEVKELKYDKKRGVVIITSFSASNFYF